MTKHEEMQEEFERTGTVAATLLVLFVVVCIVLLSAWLIFF